MICGNISQFKIPVVCGLPKERQQITYCEQVLLPFNVERESTQMFAVIPVFQGACIQVNVNSMGLTWNCGQCPIKGSNRVN